MILLVSTHHRNMENVFKVNGSFVFLCLVVVML